MYLLLQRIHQLDTLAFWWLNIAKTCPCRLPVRWLSRSGDGYLYALVAVALWLLEDSQGAFFAKACAVSFALEVTLYLLLKNTIKRDRPAVKIENYQAWIIPSDRFSFPSGHTAAAFVFAGLIAVYYPAFAAPAYLWAGLIGLSRVLLGVHYPSDIAAGALLGSCCALTGAGLFH